MGLVRSRWAIALVALGSAVSLCSTPARAAERPPVDVRITVRLDATGVLATPTSTWLRIDMPRSATEIERLLASEAGTDAYRQALRAVLQRIGWGSESSDDLAIRIVSTTERPPVVAVVRDRATLLFAGVKELAAQLTYRVPALWSVERREGSLRFVFPLRPTDSAVRWTVEAYVAGGSVLGVSPTPEEYATVNGFVEPDVQVPPRDVAPSARGSSAFVHVLWRFRGGQAADSPSLRVALRRHTRALVDSYSGLASSLRLILSYLVASLVVLPLAWLFLARAFGRLERRPDLLATLTLIAWFALLVSGSLTWLLSRSTRLEVDAVRSVFIGAGVAAVAAVAALTALRPRRGHWIALVLTASVGGLTVLAVHAHDEAGRRAFSADSAWILAQSALASLLLATAVFGATIALAVGAVRRIGAKLRSVTVVTAALGAVIAAVASTAQTGSAYFYLHERQTLLRHALFEPFPNETDWRAAVSGGLVLYPFSFIRLALDVLPIAVFAALVVLAYAEDRGETRLRTSGDALVTAAMLAFATFVVGTQGTVYGWAAPVAFLIALLLERLSRPFRHRSITEEVADVDRLNSAGEPALALREQSALIKQGLADGEGPPAIRLPEGMAPLRLALSLGPGRNAWENGATALRIGRWVALAPLAFFAFVLVTERRDSFSPRSFGGANDVIASSVHEVLFWLAAAFAFGVLFPSLPWRRGAAKGVTLAALYGVSVGLSVWILPGTGDWVFRTLELVLFLGVLGVLLERATLQRNGVRWTHLLEYYRLRDIRFGATYASAAAGVLLAVAQQVDSGGARNTIESLIKGLPSLIPQLP